MRGQIGGQAFQSRREIAVVVAEKDTHRLEVAGSGRRAEKRRASTIINVGAQVGRPSATKLSQCEEADLATPRTHHRELARQKINASQARICLRGEGILL